MSLPNLPYKGNQIPNQPFNYPEVPATFDRLFGARVANEQLDPNPDDNNGGEGWVRPADWLPMPDVSETEEKFVGLFAVYNLPGNFIALQFEGDYTVDWGDGAVENVVSGEKAQHSYSWSDIPSNTVTTEGFRQVLVSVYPQGGQNLTQLDISVRHDNCPTGDTYVSTPWLDLVISLPQAASGNSIILTNDYEGSGSSVTWSFLADVKIVKLINSGGCTELDYPYITFMSTLKQLYLSSEVTTELLLGNLSDYCPNLEELTLILPNLMFTPYLWLSNFTSLKKVTFGDLYELTSFGGFFQYSETVQEINLGNMPLLEDAYDLFNSCRQLKLITIGDTPSLTNAEYMFSQCENLVEAPYFDMSNVTSAYDIFDRCDSLESIPLYDMSNLLDFSEGFYECYSLKNVPPLDLTSLQNGAYAFYYCSSLSEIPGISLSSNATQINQFFDRCSALQSSNIIGVHSDFDYVGCLLSRDALINIFNNLGEVEGATINVSGNYGAAELTPADIAIAEGKGWTVVY